MKPENPHKIALAGVVHLWPRSYPDPGLALCGVKYDDPRVTGCHGRTPGCPECFNRQASESTMAPGEVAARAEGLKASVLIFARDASPSECLEEAGPALRRVWLGCDELDLEIQNVCLDLGRQWLENAWRGLTWYAQALTDPGQPIGSGRPDAVEIENRPASAGSDGPVDHISVPRADILHVARHLLGWDVSMSARDQPREYVDTEEAE